jgi:hypothetical protein
MRKLLKRWWFWALLVSSFVIGAGVMVLAPDEPSQAKFNRIKEGMTKEQTVAILGSNVRRKFARAKGRLEYRNRDGSGGSLPGDDPQIQEVWDWRFNQGTENRGFIRVCFNRGGIVIDKGFYGGRQTMFRQVLDWLRQYL